MMSVVSKKYHLGPLFLMTAYISSSTNLLYNELGFLNGDQPDNEDAKKSLQTHFVNVFTDQIPSWASLSDFKR